MFTGIFERQGELPAQRPPAAQRLASSGAPGSNSHSRMQYIPCKLFVKNVHACNVPCSYLCRPCHVTLRSCKATTRLSVSSCIRLDVLQVPSAGSWVWANRLLSRSRCALHALVSFTRHSATVDKLAAVELLPAWSGIGQHPPLHGAVMTLSSSPDSDSLQQLSQGSPSPVDPLQEAPRKLAVLGLPWDTRYAAAVWAGGVPAFACNASRCRSWMALHLRVHKAFRYAAAAFHAMQWSVVCRSRAASRPCNEARSHPEWASPGQIVASGGCFNSFQLSINMCQLLTHLLAAVSLPCSKPSSCHSAAVCSEDTLRVHFSQYGAVEATEVMKDRLSGKSRGFGFVTFVDPACASAALQMEHTIDGRRCEAKVALPKVRAGSAALLVLPVQLFVLGFKASSSCAQQVAGSRLCAEVMSKPAAAMPTAAAVRGLGMSQHRLTAAECTCCTHATQYNS